MSVAKAASTAASTAARSTPTAPYGKIGGNEAAFGKVALAGIPGALVTGAVLHQLDITSGNDEQRAKRWLAVGGVLVGAALVTGAAGFRYSIAPEAATARSIAQAKMSGVSFALGTSFVGGSLLAYAAH